MAYPCDTWDPSHWLVGAAAGEVCPGAHQPSCEGGASSIWRVRAGLAGGGSGGLLRAAAGLNASTVVGDRTGAGAG